jgi:hypothetical protein
MPPYFDKILQNFFFLNFESSRQSVTVKLQPGNLGLNFHNDGFITGLEREHKETFSNIGVSKGWRIALCNGEPFTQELLNEFVSGNNTYKITFDTREANSVDGKNNQEFEVPWNPNFTKLTKTLKTMAHQDLVIFLNIFFLN